MNHVETNAFVETLRGNDDPSITWRKANASKWREQEGGIAICPNKGTVTIQRHQDVANELDRKYICFRQGDKEPEEGKEPTQTKDAENALTKKKMRNVKRYLVTQEHACYATQRTGIAIYRRKPNPNHHQKNGREAKTRMNQQVEHQNLPWIRHTTPTYKYGSSGMPSSRISKSAMNTSSIKTKQE